MLCRPSRRGGATCLDLGERHFEVIEIIDRWLAPDHRYFKVRASDGNVYILRHDELAGEWEMTLFTGRP